MSKAHHPVKSSAIWLFLGNFFNRGLTMAAMIVVARWLAPEDIGLISLATAAWGLITTLFSFGISSAIIQFQEHDLNYLDTAFWINLAMAAFLMAAALFLAPLIAAYYQAPALIPVLYAFAARSFCNSLMEIHNAIISRELAFRTSSLLQALFQTLDTGATIVLAVMGAGYWSLVWPSVVLAPVKTIAWWRSCSWRPRWNFSRVYARSIFRYCVQLLGAEIMQFININADFLIVGKVLGQFSLGLYTFAYNLAQWPITNFVAQINSLALPYFAQMKDDLPSLRSRYVKMIRLVSLAAFPVFLGAALVAPEGVPLIFGDKWRASVFALQALCLFGLQRSVGSPGGRIMLALGRPDLLFRFNLVQVPVLITGILIGTRFGISGVAVASLVVLGSGGLIFMWLTVRLIYLPGSNFLRAVAPAGGSGVCMVGVLLLFRMAYYHFWSSPLGCLLLTISIGVTIYLGSLAVLFRPVFRELWDLAITTLEDFRQSQRKPLTVRVKPE